METKICSKCGVEKSITEFFTRSKQCKMCIRKVQQEYRLKNKSKRKEYDAEYYKKNKDKVKQTKIEYYQNNKELKKEYNKKYKLKNKIIINKNMNDYIKKRKKQDDVFCYKIRLKAVLRYLFIKEGKIKKSYIENILGCNSEFLYKHLLETFKNNYNYEWDKKEKVNIDHIIPLSVAKSKKDVENLFYYTNLQLLKENDNWKKSNKLDFKIKN